MFNVYTISTNKMRNTSYILLLLIVTSVTKCNGWAQNGHRVCAAVARAHIAPALLNHIESNLLKATLDEVSNDPDDIDVERRHLHWVNYVDTPSDGAQNVSSYLTSDCQIDNRECIVSAVHYICDLHQPLHVIPATYTNQSFARVLWFHGFNYTLHQVWDELPEQLHLSYESHAKWLVRHHISPEMYVTMVKQTTVDKWIDTRVAAYEIARKLNEKLVKCHTENNNERGRYICNLKFVFSARPTVDSSLASGGVRLAGYLKQSFKNKFDAKVLSLTRA